MGVQELLDALSTLRSLARLRQGAACTIICRSAPTVTSMHSIEADREGEFVGQVFKVVNDKFVGQPQLHPRDRRASCSTTTSLLNLRTGKTARVSATCLKVQGKTTSAGARGVSGRHHRRRQGRGPAHRRHDRLHQRRAASCRRRSSPRRCSGWPSSRRTAATSRRSRMGLHKIADEDPTVKVTHDPQTHELVITGVSQLHLDVIQRSAEEALRRGGRHQGAEDSLPRDDHGGRRGGPPAQEADRRPRAVRRGPPAHLSRCLARSRRNRSSARTEFANKSKFEKMRSVPLRPGLQLRVHRPHCRRHDPEPLHARRSRRAARKCWSAARWRAIACRTWPSRSTSASTTTWTSSEAAFKTAARHGASRRRSSPPSRCCWNRSSSWKSRSRQVHRRDPGRPEHQAGPGREPGQPARRPGGHLARAPLAEVTRYAAQLGSITQGQGSYTMEFSHYDMVPPMSSSRSSKAKLAHDEEE